MRGRVANIHWALLFLPLVAHTLGCDGTEGTNSTSSTSSTPDMPMVDAGEMHMVDAGSDAGPCDRDCSMIETPPCTVAVCNEGQFLGEVGSCVVIPAAVNTPCDDGKFCTVSDVCDGQGACTGLPNQCGLESDPCVAVFCDEPTQMCNTLPMGEGDPCEPVEPCTINGVCKVGKCVGEPKDCSFSPLTECNTVSCNPASNQCEPTPDATKDNAPCLLTGKLCNINKTCLAGQCVGGMPKDCSSLDVGCSVGACNPDTGNCESSPAAAGTVCSVETALCQVGACDVNGVCVSSNAPNNTPCNDYNACTQGDFCISGTCTGNPVMSCAAYFRDGFEVCPNGWTFGGDWECGKPVNVGPAAAFLGNGAIGTNIDGLYSNSQTYDTTIATSPAIDLTQATSPMVSFWAWVHTQGESFDGFNLKISTNGGMSYVPVTTVTPPYDLTIAGQSAWGGDHSAEGWRNFMADLSAYAGQSVKLRYAFRSDAASVFPGVYIDEVVVAEPPLIPLFISTSETLPDTYAGMSYSAAISKFGGTNGSVWSIKPGGTNTAWLTIDAATGDLTGISTPANVGPVVVAVRVEEPLLPSNFAEKTFYFNVKPSLYYTSFEGPCPNGWTLSGDWECGQPMVVGPAQAYLGTQCIGTQIAANYNNLQTYAGTNATSPEIDLSNATSATLTFRMWVYTEGSTYDGANLKISTNNGTTYSVVQGVVPPYSLMINGEPAWGGNQSPFGWQTVQVDLSAYAGQKIRLRFSFRSDSSGVFPGIYIDDLLLVH